MPGIHSRAKLGCPTGILRDKTSMHLPRNAPAASSSVTQQAASARTVRAMSRSSNPLARSVSFSLSAVLGLRWGSVAPAQGAQSSQTCSMRCYHLCRATAN